MEILLCQNFHPPSISNIQNFQQKTIRTRRKIMRNLFRNYSRIEWLAFETLKDKKFLLVPTHCWIISVRFFNIIISFILIWRLLILKEKKNFFIGTTTSWRGIDCMYFQFYFFGSLIIRMISNTSLIYILWVSQCLQRCDFYTQLCWI